MVVSFFDTFLSRSGCTDVSAFNPKVVRPRLLVLLRDSIMVVSFLTSCLATQAIPTSPHSIQVLLCCTEVFTPPSSSNITTKLTRIAPPHRGPSRPPGVLPAAAAAAAAAPAPKKKKRKKRDSPQSRSSEPLDPLIVGTQSVSGCPLSTANHSDAAYSDEAHSDVAYSDEACSERTCANHSRWLSILLLSMHRSSYSSDQLVISVRASVMKMSLLLCVRSTWAISEMDMIPQ